MFLFGKSNNTTCFTAFRVFRVYDLFGLISKQIKTELYSTYKRFLFSVQWEFCGFKTYYLFRGVQYVLKIINCWTCERIFQNKTNRSLYHSLAKEQYYKSMIMTSCCVFVDASFPRERPHNCKIFVFRICIFK